MDISVRDIFCVDNATFLLTTDDRLFFTGCLADPSKAENISSFKEIESMRGIKIKKIVKSTNREKGLFFALTISGEVFMWGVDKFNLAGRESSSQDEDLIRTPIINKNLLGKQVNDMYSDNYNVYFQTKDNKILTYAFFTYYSSKGEIGNHSIREIKIPKMEIKKMFYINYLAYILTTNGELYQCRKNERNWDAGYTDIPVIYNEVKRIDLKGLQIVSIGENLSYVLLSDGNVYKIIVNKYNGSLSLTEPYKFASCLDNPEIITPLDHGETAFFVTKERRIYGTGKNEVGQLGIGTTFDASNEICLIEKLSDGIISSLLFVSRNTDGGLDSLYAITNDGNLYAWGCNYQSCLGLGTTQKVYKKPTLVNVFNNNPIAKVVINRWSNFYVMKNGQIYVSGDNTAGQLGIGDFSSRAKPTLLSGFKYDTNNIGGLDETGPADLENKILIEGKDILRRYKELLTLIRTNPEYADRIREIGIGIARLTLELPSKDNQELIQALLHLGYTRKVALLTGSMVERGKSIEEQIIDALNIIGKAKL